MRTFQEASPLSEPKGDDQVDLYTLSYMAGLARDRIHQMILGAFEDSGLSKVQLARRLNMDKSRLSKILNTSSNVTAETLGKVLFAIDGSCPVAARNWPLRERALNLREPEWFADCLDGARIQTTNTYSSAIERPTTTSTKIIRRSGTFTQVSENA